MVSSGRMHECLLCAVTMMVSNEFTVHDANFAPISHRMHNSKCSFPLLLSLLPPALPLSNPFVCVCVCAVCLIATGDEAITF